MHRLDRAVGPQLEGGAQNCMALDQVVEKVEVLPSGIGALDGLLPGGGLPRARLSELSGPRSCGKRALAQALCVSALRRGLRAAPAQWREKALRLSVLLRLAVLINRSRSTRELPEVRLEVSDDSVAIRFPQGWLDENPLTIADLKRERDYLSGVEFALTYA